MSNVERTCEICGHQQHVPEYSDWGCCNCGQQYEYEEGHRIVLTSQQLISLRSLAEHEPSSTILPVED